MAKAGYHHGALRDELMAACVKLIEGEGVGAVSLRRVAREAGVSSGAPYHHFADRSALLAALAIHGFEDLGERLRVARDRAPGPIEAVGGLIETYVLFAREEPAYFQVMFRPELCQPDKHPGVRAAGDGAFDVLTEVVTDCRLAGFAPAVDPGPLLAMVWALAHGLAALWLDGPLEDRSIRLGADPHVLVQQIARALETMWAAGPTSP